MEVALLIRFLESTSLFSVMYKDYEKHLKEEIWSCHKHMNMTFDEIYHLPIQDRKMYISLHNKEVKKMNEKLKQKKND